jgi:hypothetical protein
MQVQCTKCSQPIALTDIIESHNGHLSHVDCKRPHVLTPEERALVFVYCSGHVVARCPACDISFRYNELAADILAGGRTNMCPRCRRDLTENVRRPPLRLRDAAVRGATQGAGGAGGRAMLGEADPRTEGQRRRSDPRG